MRVNNEKNILLIFFVAIVAVFCILGFNVFFSFEKAEGKLLRDGTGLESLSSSFSL